MKHVIAIVSAAVLVTSIGFGRPELLERFHQRPGPVDGRIPLDVPDVIEEPGHYYLTKDITLKGGTGFLIVSSDVTLDLNSHRLSSESAQGSIISVQGGSNISILNGSLEGGLNGITGGAESIKIHEVEITGTRGTAIRIAANYLEVTSCVLREIGRREFILGMSVEATSGRIEDNTILDSFYGGMTITGFSGGHVIGNRISTGGGVTGTGLAISGDQNIIESNIVTNNVHGLSVGGNDNMIRFNVVTDNEEGGLNVGGDGNSIIENIVSRNGDGDGPMGLLVGGSHNLVQGNQVTANTGDGIIIRVGEFNLFDNNYIAGNHQIFCGIRLNESGQHILRNNVIFNNGDNRYEEDNSPEGPICGLQGNTDGGGNVTD